MKLFSGSSNRAFAESVAKHLNVDLGKMPISRFADGEFRIEIEENIRGNHIFLIQSTCPPVNENYMELFIILDALKRASVSEITLVMPYYGYARQDRKSSPRVPISAKCVADLISQTGVNRVLVVDLHSPQIQGFFDIPVDNLFAGPTLAEYWLKEHPNKSTVCVSPDAGGMDRVRGFAKRLKNSSIAMINKKRVGKNQAKALQLVGNVEGKTALLFDDIIDTAGTLCEAANKLIEAGATEVVAMASHPILSPPALERIVKSEIKKVFITDTIPIPEEVKKCSKIHVVSVAPLIGEAIDRIFNKKSVSSLFN